ncbi:MAG: isochorismatase family cysteine hydrolase [Pseudomonadota bacterium]
MDDAELPRCRRALVLVDFMNPLDFEGTQALTGPALAAGKAAAGLALEARRAGTPVIYANDNFGGWRSDFTTMVKRLEKQGGASASLVKLLRPRRGDLTVLKPMHSAFYGTPLDIILGKIGVTSVTLAGLATDICIQMTAADAFLRGLKVHVPGNCCAAESAQKHEIALAYMREILKCDTRPWAAKVQAQRTRARG